MDRLNCKVVNIESLKKTRKHKKWSLMTRLKKFWKYTAERFFVLEELMDAYDLEHVVHLENDNLLYGDWNLIESKLELFYPGVSMPADHPDYCVAGIMWINKKAVLAEFSRFLTLKEAKKCINEMYMLRKFMNMKNYDTLPVLCQPEMGIELPWSQFGKNMQELDGIFDASAIGPYMGGADKRTYIDILNGRYNNIPVEVEIKKAMNSRINWEKVSISWIRDDEGRYFLEINGIKVYNLHIHSKELYKYASQR